ncbi:anti-sigma factor family protein [Methylovirgula sp. 4M-Z18]|uniref:anti-sigma factor family protein n=1 Tax=Methylovirgula sp. 4M-Z18 TaxID=2293567 RepID=UPI000E2EE299|nr:anti-sigma factor [Methylovirgula sp. 4M-Z18]RFB81414.1 anti-sigma factor [Methylovirgula sp. 4M-Z18]
MSDLSPRDKILRLNAYLDGELDAGNVLAMEDLLRQDAGLKAEHDRLVALRGALRQVTPERARDDFRAKIAAIGAPKPADNVAHLNFALPRKTFWTGGEWQRLAATFLIAAFLGGGLTYWLTVPNADDLLAQNLVTDHQRSLLAAQPFDVASSDRHTVKPWFDTKLAISPPVVLLTEDGFELAGGRADIVKGRAVPTMVYRRREHLISVTAIPQIGSEIPPLPPRALNGYNVLTWQGQGFTYWAVSDIAPEELAGFAKAFQKAAAAL